MKLLNSTRFTTPIIRRYFGSSTQDLVTLTAHNSQIAIITIQRPHVKNAINRETAEALSNCIKEFESNPQYKIGLLQGADGNFCTGADLKAIEKGHYNRLENTGDAPLGPSRYFIKKPLIAIIQGYAVAGGLELACLCDLRVMEEDAIIGVFCRRWGVPLIDGGTVRLPRLIGLSRAMDLILTGRPVHAQEAYQMGFANRIVPKGTGFEVAVKLAEEIASFPQECLLADRENTYHQFHMSLEEGLQAEFTRSKSIAQYLLQDGMKRFKAKEYKDKPYASSGIPTSTSSTTDAGEHVDSFKV